MYPRIPFGILALAALGTAQPPSFLLQKSGGSASLFGSAVCFVGDLDHDGRSEVAFGAPLSGTGGIGAGSVQVFRGDGALLFTIVGTAYQSLGIAIAAAGDVNRDGTPDLLVGGRGSITQNGLMNVYSGLDGTLLRARNGATAGDALGEAVAGLGDVDADGYPDLACTDRHNSGGAVLVWSGKDGSLLRTILGAAPGEGAGITIANVGDVDGDGAADLGVGIPLASLAATGGGVARVYSGRTNALLVEKRGTVQGGALGTAIVGLGADWSGDGRVDLAVGAPGEDGGTGPGSGVALALDRSGNVLARFPGLLGDGLGGALAGAGDVDGDRVPDLAVAALGKYVRVHSGAQGHAVLHLVNAFAVASGFANALDLRGDLDGDGFADLAIGSPLTAPTQSGSAAVLDLGHSWLPRAILTRVGSVANGALGSQACALGDTDGDGRTEIAAGAVGTGEIVVLRPDGSVRFAIQLGAPSLVTLSALAPAGDVDGDGVGDLLVGTRDVGAFLKGGVQVRSGVDGALLRSASGDAGGDELGAAVAGLGDLDGDGYDEYAAGAPFGLPTRQGYVRVWSGRTGAVLRTLPGDAANELFGVAIAGVGDVDGDGVPDLGVGAPAATRRAPKGGFVRVYSGRTFATIAEKTGNTNDEGLGTAVAALGGDWDGDGLDDYVAGSPRNDDGAGFEAGSVFVFNLAGNVLRRFDGSPGDKLGEIVAGAGDGDGDGRPEVAGSALAKYVRVFSGAGDHAKLHEFAAPHAGFGTALDLRADFDGDGMADLVLGAAGSGAGVGSVQVFDLDHPGAPARVVARGRACATSDLRLPHLDARGRPALGNAFAVRLRAAKANAATALWIGLPLQLHLTPYGAPGCTAAVNPFATLGATSDASGVASYAALAVPYDAALLGLRLDFQALVADATANALGIVFSTQVIAWVGT